MSTEKKGNRSPLLILIITGIGLYLAYLLIILLAKLLVYTGYNFFVFTDNLFEISSFNPVATWGIMGMFIGSIAGVAIAIKKYRLSGKLVLYPIGISILLLIIFYFVNEPANHNGAETFPNTSSYISEPSNAITVSKDFFYTTRTVNARSGASLRNYVVFVVNEGDEVEIVERNFTDSRGVEWMKVNYRGQAGFISSKFLRFSRRQ